MRNVELTLTQVSRRLDSAGKPVLFHQDQVDAAVKQLLALKAEYKQQTGQEYKPGLQAPASPAQTQAGAASTQSSTPPQAQELYTQVAQQGELVRKLKTEKAAKVRQPPVVFTAKLKEMRKCNAAATF